MSESSFIKAMLRIALRVLDDLGRLGDTNAAGGIDAGLDDRAVKLLHLGERLLRVPRHDLDDLRQGPGLVAGIDPLR
jgi:hypothetical protein